MPANTMSATKLTRTPTILFEGVCRVLLPRRFFKVHPTWAFINGIFFTEVFFVGGLDKIGEK